MASTRRTFLKQLGATGVVSLSGMPPEFLVGLQGGNAKIENAVGPERILVLVELAGGNDGLNTVIPHGDPEYHRARPGIGIDKGAVLRIDEHLGLHPQMGGFKELYDAGRLAIIQGVGYPQPSRSHFHSMDIWQSARIDTNGSGVGWIGRALDRIAVQNEGKVPAMAIGTDELPLALVGAKVNLPTLQSIEDYRLRLGASPEADRALRHQLITALANRPSPRGSDLDFLCRTERSALSSAAKLQEIASTPRPHAAYPGNGLGRQLETVAQLISGELETRIYYVSMGSFDTHSRQSGAHQALLAELSSAVHAFYGDLDEMGLADRVLLVTYSEFGRRVQENGSLGTDHGAAGPMFAVAPAGKGGLFGDHPSLTDLDQGDLKFHTDFRSVYATILEHWLEMPAAAVLGAEYPLLDFV